MAAAVTFAFTGAACRQSRGERSLGRLVPGFWSLSSEERGREDFVGEPVLAFERMPVYRYSSSGVNVLKHVLAHTLVYFEYYLELASCWA